MTVRAGLTTLAGSPNVKSHNVCRPLRAASTIRAMVAVRRLVEDVVDTGLVHVLFSFIAELRRPLAQDGVPSPVHHAHAAAAQDAVDAVTGNLDGLIRRRLGLAHTCTPFRPAAPLRDV
jgi:hypothetical protein